ncbi:hypothetical protein HDF24_04830 [Mucilaginibacter sp. X4EP1]|uniref:hypothetical protein n=1 Tax=Mucilaginibacter sp. X4EP1 TaxID=2723092 RepID=UPI00216746D5|nr:hypothetical protein [Mucilaginibacter sp. X4EP1]MCS3816528.1 hypothetical protein [Mucilaginibacter sp. X4EP1]
MKISIGPLLKTMAIALFLTITATVSSNAQAPGAHPYYLHALSDLRAARWMIEHRPGNWVQTDLEISALNEINAAIGEIKKAAIDDGKNIEDHPPVDERNDHKGRLHEAHDFLKKAHQDVDQEEDDPYTRGLKHRASKHIDAALQYVKQAIQF